MSTSTTNHLSTRLLGGAVALMALQGCAVEVGNGENFADLRANVLVMDQAMLNGATVEENRLLVPEANDSRLATLDVGHVVVSDVGEGYLRRVTDITRDNDGLLVMNTELAPLSAAAENAHMSHTYGDGQYFDPDRAEIIDFGFDVNFDGTPLYSQDGLDVVLSQGNISFRPTVDFEFDLSWGRLETLHLIADGDIDANLVVTARAEQGFTGSRDFTYTLYESPPKIIVHFIGVLPVVEVITATVDAHFEVTANVNGTAEVGLSANANVMAGVRWQDGRLEPLADAGLELDPVGPTLHVGGELTARATIEPRLTVKFYGAAGASVGVQAYGGLDAAASVDASLEGVEFEGMCDLLLGVSGDVRAELPVFDLEDFDRQLFDINNSIDCTQLF